MINPFARKYASRESGRAVTYIPSSADIDR